MYAYSVLLYLALLLWLQFIYLFFCKRRVRYLFALGADHGTRVCAQLCRVTAAGTLSQKKSHTSSEGWDLLDFYNKQCLFVKKRLNRYKIIL